jgi:PAS domain S-box-containing protein
MTGRLPKDGRTSRSTKEDLGGVTARGKIYVSICHPAAEVCGEMNSPPLELPPAEYAPPLRGRASNPTHLGMRRIEQREWWLWASAVLVTLLLTLGIASFALPTGTSPFGLFDELHMNLAVRGLIGLVLLFDIYVIYQQYQIRGIRHQLTKQDDLFRLITEQAADMIAVVDTGGRRVYNSPSYERIMGYTPEELGATSSLEQIHPDDREKIKEAAAEASRSGLGRQIEYRMRHRDGSWRVLESTASTILDAEGRVDKLVIVNRDITDRKRAEAALLEYKIHLEELVATRTAELIRANEQLQLDITGRNRTQQELTRKLGELARSNADLEQFAYVASHDLQEPLRMVISYTQLLARRYRGKLDASADEFIEFAVDGASRMQQLIQDLLSYSRLTTQGKALQFTHAEAACNVALENLQESIKDSKAKVSVGPLPTVVADATQLAQLFQNLIGNAIKYRNKRKPEIQVGARADGNEWVFSVHDNGIGIEAQYFERIFQMFQRLHTRKDYSGTGIGLAVCRKIVERHGGKIWVESHPGQGSTFLFTIPHAEKMEK